RPPAAEWGAGVRSAAETRRQPAGSEEGAGAAAARRLAANLVKLADAGAAQRAAAASSMVDPMVSGLADLRLALQARPVTRADVPPEIAREWVAPDGRARVEAGMRGDPNDNEAIRAFARAVLATAPGATGEAIGIMEGGETIVHAFLQAGGLARVLGPMR